MAENNLNFGNSNGNGAYGQRESTSTYGINLFSNDNLMLKISLYNDSLAIEFALPEVDSMTGKTKYPNDPSHRISFILTPERVATLYSIIEKDIIPAIIENKPVKSGFPVNALGTRVIDMVYDEMGNLMIRGFANIDMNTRKPQIAVYFPFNKIINIRDYDKDTGSFSSREIDAAFQLFTWVIKSYLVGTSAFAAHSIKKDYFFKTEVKRFHDIAAKLGLPVDTKNYSYGNTSGAFGNNAVSESNGSNTIAYPQAPSVGPREVENLDKLLEDELV